LAETPAQLRDAARNLSALASQVAADTVQVHSPALTAGAAWRVPVVAVAHSCIGTWWHAVRGGTVPRDMAWRADAVARGLAVADVIIAPSRSFADALRACYGSARPIEVILNGRRPILNSAPRRQQALTAGRLWDEGKNVAALDAAAAVVSWPVLAAGSTAGPNGATAVFRNIRLLGNLDEASLAAEYARASVFVSVSRYEPFGLAVLEAAQSGCALILSDIPTFRELWNGAALFVPPNDPCRIGKALHQLLQSKHARRSQANLAHQQAAAFSLEREIAATWAIHERLSKQPQARTAA